MKEKEREMKKLSIMPNVLTTHGGREEILHV
jgi:hypothetical protein